MKKRMVSKGEFVPFHCPKCGGEDYYVVMEKARPKGAKDVKPRKKKLSKKIIEMLRERERKAQMWFPFVKEEAK